jgi:hypothetical protein
MRVQLPRGAARGYLIAFEATAIYVATMPKGEPSLIGISSDLDRSITELRRRFGDVECGCALWIRDRKIAKAIVREAKARLPRDEDGTLAVRGDTARNVIERIAADRQVKLTSHDAVLARVRDAVAEIESRIRSANRRGELDWFNHAYRAWRVEAKKCGRGMSYETALARLRNEAIKQLISLGVNDLGAGLLSRVFPPPPAS